MYLVQPFLSQAIISWTLLSFELWWNTRMDSREVSMFTMPELSESNKLEWCGNVVTYTNSWCYKNTVYLNTQSPNHSISKKNTHSSMFTSWNPIACRLAAKAAVVHKYMHCLWPLSNDGLLHIRRILCATQRDKMILQSAPGNRYRCDEACFSNVL